MKSGKFKLFGGTGKGKADDDEKDVRQQVRDLIDGKAVTILMTVVTLWALFGDDIRLVALPKSVDEGFYISYTVCLAFFAWELVTNCLVQEEYKYSFFFWLDLIATVSMILDIPYIIDPYLADFSYYLPSSDVSINTKVKSGQDASSYAQRILKSFRLIRLVRIVKLYKYFTKSNTEEEEQRLREAQRLAQNARQAAMNREMDPTRLGKRLSDTTTKRVIIGVLLLLLVLPIMQVQNVDSSKYYGLQQLFWAGRSACYRESQFGCEADQLKYWVTEDGWFDLLYRYSKSSESSDGGSIEQPLLWLRVPDFMQDGIVGDMKEIKHHGSNETAWTEESDCSGKMSSLDCLYRDEEMQLVVYYPGICQNATEKNYEACQELYCYARFSIQSQTQNDALLSIFITIFIGIILAVGSVTFTVDTQEIIIVPITKMVLVIKGLADDPLKKPEKHAKHDITASEDNSTGQELQEQMLIDTVSKISDLLLLSFGEDGAQIISKNISGEGELNLMRPGTKVDIVIAICKIQDLAEIADTLNEEVTGFVNRVASIVHLSVCHWGGSIAKNDCMGMFVAIWKLPDIGDRDANQESESNPALRRTDIANRALIAFVKIIAEIRRSAELEALKANPKIQGKYGAAFNTKVYCGLHIGWAVEGVIGSDLKIDPAYLSSDIQLAVEITSANQFYNSQLLMTEHIYGILSVKAKSRCRRIDNVYVQLQKDPFGVYTFDMTNEVVPMPEVHSIGALIKLTELASVNVESFEHQGVDYVFTLDSDLVLLQRGFTHSFYSEFRNAYAAYVGGDWGECLTMLANCLTQRSEDGPTLALKSLIEEQKGKPPEDWPGCRPLPV